MFLPESALVEVAGMTGAGATAVLAEACSGTNGDAGKPAPAAKCRLLGRAMFLPEITSGVARTAGSNANASTVTTGEACSGAIGVVAGKPAPASNPATCCSCSGDSSCEEDDMTNCWLKWWSRWYAVAGVERAESGYAMSSKERRIEEMASTRAPI